MDFIEQLFGVSPDNGDGTTELLWLVVLAILLGAALYWRRHHTVPLWLGRRRRHRRLGIAATIPKQASFTCVARTVTGDREAVLVTCNIDVADTVGLVGAVVLIDGADHVVYDVISRTGTSVRAGQSLMMKVGKL